MVGGEAGCPALAMFGEGSMESDRFDAVARVLSGSGSRRRVFAAIGAALLTPSVGRDPIVQGAAFDRRCSEFIISGGKKKNKKLDDVDDDLLIELQRQGSTNWEVIFEDDNGGVNGGFGFRPIPPIRFRARVGDKLRITATNVQAGGCSLDALWLHCAKTKKRGNERAKGKRLTDAYVCPSNQANREDFVFLERVVVISP